MVYEVCCCAWLSGLTVFQVVTAFLSLAISMEMYDYDNETSK